MNNCSTPKNKTLHLGLRKQSKSCGAPVNNKLSKEQTKSTTPHDDEKATPSRATAVRVAPERLTASTNCRPYRLALNKNIRDKLTKKRLQFHLANEGVEDVATSQSSIDSTEDKIEIPTKPTTGQVSLPRRVSRENYVEKKESICNQEQNKAEEEKQHESKVRELKSEIQMWKTAFAAALDELQETQTIEPKMDKVALLQQLQIPLEMLKYTND